MQSNDGVIDNEALAQALAEKILFAWSAAEAGGHKPAGCALHVANKLIAARMVTAGGMLELKWGVATEGAPRLPSG